MRQRFSVLLIGLALLAASGTARAQSSLEADRYLRQLQDIQLDSRLRVDMNVPPDQRMLVDYGGYTTYNFLSADDPQGGHHLLQEQDFGGYAHVNLDGVHDFFIRAHSSYKAWMPDQSLDGNNYYWVQPTLDRAIYRFDLQRAMGAYDSKAIKGDVTLSGGRQLVQWANGLVISQEIDGALIDLSYGTAKLEVLAGETRGRTPDEDTSLPDFRHSYRGFYGAMLSGEVAPSFRPYVYGLVQQDNNNDPALTALTTNVVMGVTTTNLSTTKFGYNSFYIGAGSTGVLGDHLRYGFEAAYEGGSTRSSDTDPSAQNTTVSWQSTDDISAAAADFQLDYLFNDAHNSRLSAEVIVATGDHDRGLTNTTVNGNKPFTLDTAFNAYGTLNTGLAFAPHVSNIAVARIGAVTFPWPSADIFRHLQAGVDVLCFGKLDSNAPIDEPTGQGFYLGTEVDTYTNWQITSDLSLAVRYGIFCPNSIISSSHEPRNFVYTGLTFTF